MILAEPLLAVRTCAVVWNFTVTPPAASSHSSASSFSALVFAWDNAKRIRARKRIDENGIKHYEIYGPLFFGSTTAFNEKFDVLNDPEEVIVDFSESRIADMSGIEAVNKLTNRYAKQGKKLHLRHLSQDCRRLLNNADAIIEVNIIEDPTYHVVTDKVK